jgi:hypothetical protein
MEVLLVGRVDEVVGVVPVELASLSNNLALRDRQETGDLDALTLLAELHQTLDDRSLVDLETTVRELGSEFHHEDILANYSAK